MMKVGISAIGLALLVGCAQGGQSPQHAAVGAPAPSFSEPTVTGTSLTMASLVGKPVWLNFFATWCGPCNEEAPVIETVSTEFAPRGLQIVGVDVLENAAKAKEFVEKHKLNYPAIIDSGALRDAYNINGMPVSVFIDKAGVVKKIEVGELSRDEMEADVKAIL
jgi:cytochrome c biogenesis protein CcmG, thiol:disulfide interchange protein DsbE